jgi:hypothetical protein
MPSMPSASNPGDLRDHLFYGLSAAVRRRHFRKARSSGQSGGQPHGQHDARHDVFPNHLQHSRTSQSKGDKLMSIAAEDAPICNLGDTWALCFTGAPAGPGGHFPYVPDRPLNSA